MKYKIIDETIDKIKKLEIQGATSIAIKGVRAIRLEIENDPEVLENSDFFEKIKELKYSRPTEPMLRNSIDLVFKILDNFKDYRDIIEKLKKLESILIETSDKISEYGKNLIESGIKVLTHCHSSTVTKTLIKARKEGKFFLVYNTETRPKYQGRKTARELIENGIKVVHFVDFAINHFIRDIDLILLGADSILANGSFINKVGSSIIAILADKYDIPLYSLASLLKVNFYSIFGNLEKIEERDPKEVWDFEDKNLEIRNPAFDLVYKRYTTAFVTELGIVSPSNILEEAENYIKKVEKELVK